MQSHNVVYFDHDTNKFVVDTETTYNRFGDGAVYSEEAGRWFIPEQGSVEEQKEFEAFRLLEKLLNDNWNEENK